MLNKLQKLREEREQGFTLIELLVVILIIGILAAIAVPAFLKQRKSVVDSTVESDVTNAAKVVESGALAGKGQELAVSGDTSSGQPFMVGSEDITDEIKKGSDTNLKLEGTTSGYVITGTNEAGTDDGAKQGIVYDSTKGGLLKAVAGTTPPPSTNGSFSKSGTVENFSGGAPTRVTYTATISKDGNGTITLSDKSLNEWGNVFATITTPEGNRDVYLDMPLKNGVGKFVINPAAFDIDMSKATALKSMTVSYDFGWDYE